VENALAVGRVRLEILGYLAGEDLERLEHVG